MKLLKVIGTILLAALMLFILIISWYAFAVLAVIIVIIILIKAGVKYYEIKEDGVSFKDTIEKHVYEKILIAKEEGKLPDFKGREEKFNNMFEELEKKFRPS